ncbi:MAG: YdeI/OmpD-associated family protein [Aureliella sp.]
MNPKIDDYLAEGCGRCPLGGTPDCKVHAWQTELKLLRDLVLACGLTEELKWKMPCYTLDGRNIVMVSALKECAQISFFKGALLTDSAEILEKPGENSQAARVVRFTSSKAVRQASATLKKYIGQAIQIEQAGLKVDFQAKTELVLPDELSRKLDSLPALRAAWEALTPGRQRGYVLYFSSAKQSATRESRIDKCAPRILEGLGIHD